MTLIDSSTSADTYYVTPAYRPAGDENPFADFEGADYGSWVATGNAFEDGDPNATPVGEEIAWWDLGGAGSTQGIMAITADSQHPTSPPLSVERLVTYEAS